MHILDNNDGYSIWPIHRTVAISQSSINVAGGPSCTLQAHNINGDHYRRRRPHRHRGRLQRYLQAQPACLPVHSSSLGASSCHITYGIIALQIIMRLLMQCKCQFGNTDS